MKIKEVRISDKYLIIETDEGPRKIKTTFPKIDEIEKKCKDFMKRQCLVDYSTYGDFDNTEWFSDVWEVEENINEANVSSPGINKYELPTQKKFKHQTSQKVFGPPGTGKTTILIERVKDAVASATETQNIAFISFSNEAARVARERVCGAFPELGETAFPFFCTIHSLATTVGGKSPGATLMEEEHFRAFDGNIKCEVEWRRTGDPLSATVRPKHRVLDAFSKSISMGIPMNYLSFSREVMNGPKKWRNETILTLASYFKLSYDNVCKGLAHYSEKYVDEFVNYKEKNQLVSFDDVIRTVSEETFPTTLIPTFDLLIIDEAQDLTTHLWQFTKKLIKVAGKTYIAGDDDQSIMIGIGANPQEFINLNTTEDDLHLEQSHRVPQLIHNYINLGVMNHIRKLTDRAEKEWKPLGRRGSVGFSKLDTCKNLISDKKQIIRDVGTCIDSAECSIDQLLGILLKEYKKYHGFNMKLGSIEWKFRPDINLSDFSDTLKGSFKENNTDKEIIIDPALIDYIVQKFEKNGLGDDHIDLLEDLGVLHSIKIKPFIQQVKREKPLLPNWLIMSPTRATGKKISDALCIYQVPHFYLNKPKVGATETNTQIKVSTIHGSKGAEADNTAIVVNNFKDYEMLANDPRLSYVALTRAKKRLLPKVGDFNLVNSDWELREKYETMFPDLY